jgi:hypothetical protein
MSLIQAAEFRITLDQHFDFFLLVLEHQPPPLLHTAMDTPATRARGFERERTNRTDIASEAAIAEAITLQPDHRTR